MSAIVYRCYDADERLLYVGCTTATGPRRLCELRSKGASWAEHVAEVHQDEYPTLETARRAEAALIRALRPIHNVQHQPLVPTVTAARVDGLVGVTEVASALGWSRAKVKRAAKAGELPHAVKMPGDTGAYLFHRAVITMIAKRPETAA